MREKRCVSIEMMEGKGMDVGELDDGKDMDDVEELDVKEEEWVRGRWWMKEGSYVDVEEE